MTEHLWRCPLCNELVEDPERSDGCEDWDCPVNSEGLDDECREDIASAISYADKEL